MPVDTYFRHQLALVRYTWEELVYRVNDHMHENDKQESPSDARVTRDSSACMKAPYGRILSSAGNPILEPNITSIGKPVELLWPFFYIEDGRQLLSWIFEIWKLHH